jgi:Lhr-like helicase
MNQEERSHIPKEDEFLVELIKNREGYHLFMYPFEGRLVHEVMSALIAYRISKLAPISFSMAMNDYGFELFSDKEIPLNEENLHKILSRENLMTDVISSINSAEMARRKFRDIAVISGMVIQNYAGKQRSNKSLQSSAGLIFKVLEDYDPNHFLVRQAYTEVFNAQLQEQRLVEAFKRIEKSKIILKFANTFTPLSFPIKVDSLRQTLSSEGLDARIQKLIQQAKKENLSGLNPPSVPAFVCCTKRAPSGREANLVIRTKINNYENSNKKYPYSGRSFHVNQSESIILEKEKALILSDLHIGKTAHFRKNGIALSDHILKMICSDYPF